MVCFLRSGIWISSLLSLSVCSPLLAKPLIPVSQLTITAQDQQALRAALPHDTDSVATWIWQGDPLKLVLALHQEYRLMFSEPVQVDLNGQLTSSQLRVINDHQIVYLTALQSFQHTARFYVTLKNSGRIIFLDISTTEKKNKSTASKIIHVEVTPNLKSTSRASVHAVHTTPDLSEGMSASDYPFFSNSADDFVQAGRFAWQQLYAPQYILSNEAGFMRSPMHTSFWISGLFYSDAVFAHPIAAWTRNDLFVTAVELRNPYPQAASLDLAHDLCGHWRAATLYPRTRLQPAGDKPNDGATLFLISSEPFDQVFSGGGCNHGRA